MMKLDDMNSSRPESCMMKKDSPSVSRSLHVAVLKNLIEGARNVYFLQNVIG